MNFASNEQPARVVTTEEQQLLERLVMHCARVGDKPLAYTHECGISTMPAGAALLTFRWTAERFSSVPQSGDLLFDIELAVQEQLADIERRLVALEALKPFRLFDTVPFALATAQLQAVHFEVQWLGDAWLCRAPRNSARTENLGDLLHSQYIRETSHFEQQRRKTLNLRLLCELARVEEKGL